MSDPVYKLGTFIPLTREMVEDMAAMPTWEQIANSPGRGPDPGDPIRVEYAIANPDYWLVWNELGHDDGPSLVGVCRDEHDARSLAEQYAAESKWHDRRDLYLVAGTWDTTTDG